jgi:hypothetical protein
MDSATDQTAEGKAVVTVLAAVLERLVESNSHLPNDQEVTKFHALKAPGISVRQYLERIHKYASCSTECFILALIYIDRLIQRNNFVLSELNVHRVLVTSVLLAAKFFDDAYYNNAYYAKVGGVLTSEMNGLEVEFLFRINFSLHVTPEIFKKYQDELISHAICAGMNQPAQEMSRAAQESFQTHMATPVDTVSTDHHVFSPNGVNIVSSDESKFNQVDHYNHMVPKSETQASLSQHDWSNNTDATPIVHRHITPSPPQQHQDYKNNGVSPAYSDPGGPLNNFDTFIPTSRPRNNSYPTGDVISHPRNMGSHITIDHFIHPPQHYSHGTHVHGSMMTSSNSLPCSHYNHRIAQTMCQCNNSGLCQCNKSGMNVIWEPQRMR